MHSLCMSVSKMCITILWRSSKIAPLFMSVPKMRITIYEGPKKCISFAWEPQQCASRFFMKAFKMRISFLWVFQNFASWYMKVIKNASPLYERFNNVQHGFMKALKMCISFFLCLSKICITIYEGRKNCISFVRRFNNAHHGFMKAFYNAHLLFMRLSKIWLTIYEGLNNLHLLWWAPQKVLHHNLWACLTNTHNISPNFETSGGGGGSLSLYLSYLAKSFTAKWQPGPDCARPCRAKGYDKAGQQRRAEQGTRAVQLRQ